MKPEGAWHSQCQSCHPDCQPLSADDNKGDEGNALFLVLTVPSADRQITRDNAWMDEWLDNVWTHDVRDRACLRWRTPLCTQTGGTLHQEKMQNN